jgi:hypothetical protein
MALIEDTFHPRPLNCWRRTQVGGGRLVLLDDGLRLLLAGARHTAYSDAQIDDYAGLARRRFPWRPPLRMTVRARASGALAGTAGFGFWNNPFSPLGGTPALPAALWFFYGSPPSDMPLALGVPGHGWKAACIDATRLAALAWAPLTLPVLLANRVPALYRRIWPMPARPTRGRGTDHRAGASVARIYDRVARGWGAFLSGWRGDAGDGSTAARAAGLGGLGR